MFENLQIEINDVHISLKESDCTAAGVVLEYLLVATTDAKGKHTLMDRTAATNKSNSPSFLHKLLQLNGLQIYLDPDDHLTTSFKSLTSIRDDNINDNALIVLILLLRFHSKQNYDRLSDNNECIDYPKYLLASTLDSVNPYLSKHQLELIHKIQAKIQPILNNSARPLFPEYRPLRQLTKETAKDWWKYAARCVGRLDGKRGWSEFYSAFQKRQQYIPL